MVLIPKIKENVLEGHLCPFCLVFVDELRLRKKKRGLDLYCSPNIYRSSGFRCKMLSHYTYLTDRINGPSMNPVRSSTTKLAVTVMSTLPIPRENGIFTV